MKRPEAFHNLNFRCKRLLEAVESKGEVYADTFGQGDRARLEELRKRGFLRTEFGIWSGLVKYLPA